MNDLKIQIAILNNELREVRQVIFEMDSRLRFLVPVTCVISILVGSLFGTNIIPPIVKCVGMLFQ